MKGSHEDRKDIHERGIGGLLKFYGDAILPQILRQIPDCLRRNNGFELLAACVFSFKIFSHDLDGFDFFGRHILVEGRKIPLFNVDATDVGDQLPHQDQRNRNRQPDQNTL